MCYYITIQEVSKRTLLNVVAPLAPLETDRKGNNKMFATDDGGYVMVREFGPNKCRVIRHYPDGRNEEVFVGGYNDSALVAVKIANNKDWRSCIK